jgi:hypothetical protein
VPALPMADIAAGNLHTLMRALHDLHARAGWPSTRKMAEGHKFSHATVHDLFTKTSTTAPKLPVLLDVVAYLACLDRRINDADAEIDRFDAMWDAARLEPFGPGFSHRTAGRSVIDGGNALNVLLAAPSAHLIIDGSRVNRTGDNSELSLADQRNRLVGQLGVLANQTGVEITVVFDGVGVTSVPTRMRGVRVLFGDSGVLAEEVVREVAAVEPSYRPVILATSDRSVEDLVRRRGALVVAPELLLGRLGLS